MARNQHNIEHMTNKLQNVNVDDLKDINILLLGETGVGKSTFINAIANYLYHKNFQRAEKENLLILVPSKFTVSDINNVQKQITVGADSNEHLEVGASATQNVRAYVFAYAKKNIRLRLIDTPGMGDVRGIDQDNINAENILSFIGELKQLHAVCFLLKPHQSRATVMFEFCIKQIMSRLDKSACKNIIFLFTHSGDSDKPSETLAILRKLIGNIKKVPPHACIPLNDDNCFCFNNVAFRYLAAMKNGVRFNAEDKERNYIPAWQSSYKELKRLIKYIIGDDCTKGLEPHLVGKTVCINEARRLITQLSQPLADITTLIEDNLRTLERHIQHLRLENSTLEELKTKLYMPIINLKVINLAQPATVCASDTCTKIYQVGTLTKREYCQRCHDPCYLTKVSPEIIGEPGLINCAAMCGAKRCQKCSCDFSSHMHIYYKTTTFEDKFEDTSIKTNINSKQDAIKKAQDIICTMKKRQTQLEYERDCIINYTAQFAYFLQHNAITPYNDAYEGYIQYLIDRENSLGTATNRQNVLHLYKLLQQYKAAKSAFDKAFSENATNGVNVTAKDVRQNVENLFKLELTGSKIRELYKSQKTARNKEHDNQMEYIHVDDIDIEEKQEIKKTSKQQKKRGREADQLEKYQKPHGAGSFQHNARSEYPVRGSGVRSRSSNPAHHYFQNHGGFRNQHQPYQNNTYHGEAPPPYHEVQNFGPASLPPPRPSQSHSYNHPRQNTQVEVKVRYPDQYQQPHMQQAPFNPNPRYFPPTNYNAQVPHEYSQHPQTSYQQDYYQNSPSGYRNNNPNAFHSQENFNQYGQPRTNMRRPYNRSYSVDRNFRGRGRSFSRGRQPSEDKVDQKKKNSDSDSSF